MPEFDEVLADPEMGAASFLVTRTNYRRTRGQLVDSTTLMEAEGCIHPGTPEMLQLVPEEERREKYIVIYTSFRLRDGENPSGSSFQAADRITYDGAEWRVIRVQEWREFNYVQALAVKMEEDDES